MRLDVRSTRVERPLYVVAKVRNGSLTARASALRVHVLGQNLPFGFVLNGGSWFATKGLNWVAFYSKPGNEIPALPSRAYAPRMTTCQNLDPARLAPGATACLVKAGTTRLYCVEAGKARP